MERKPIPVSAIQAAHVHNGPGARYRRSRLAATSAMQSLTALHRWQNINRAEQSAIKLMREFDVGYNTADKKYGAVVFSKELSKEQCLLHLEGPTAG